LKRLSAIGRHFAGPERVARDGEGVSLRVGVTVRELDGVLLDDGVREFEGVLDGVGDLEGVLEDVALGCGVLLGLGKALGATYDLELLNETIVTWGTLVLIIASQGQVKNLIVYPTSEKEIFVADALVATRAAVAANFQVVDPSSIESKTRAYVVLAPRAGHDEVVNVIKLLNVFGVDTSEGVRAT